MTTNILIAAVCLIASTVGAAVGIGGGVIIKPTIDMMGVMSVQTISFLSGITVLCMSTYNVAKDRLTGHSPIDIRLAAAISTGAAMGGIVGKIAFGEIINRIGTETAAGAAQAACLFVLTVITLVYSLNKKRMPRFMIRSFGGAAVAGMILGIFSSFLGIGGGPINIMFLSMFFSMETQGCVAYSLFVIMCSQTASLVWQIATHTVPDFQMPTLVMMALCGVGGGMVGSRLKRYVNIDRLFEVVLGVIMVICVYNFIKMIN